MGPASSGAIYSAFGTQAPFITGALLLLPAILLLRGARKTVR